MKHKRHSATHYWLLPQPVTKLSIQVPLPHCLDTLPILLSIEGQGSGRQGPSPLAPPEQPANDKH